MVNPIQITDANFIVSTQPIQRLQKQHRSLLVVQSAKTRKKRLAPIPLKTTGKFQWTQPAQHVPQNKSSQTGQHNKLEEDALMVIERRPSPTNDNHFGALRRDPFNSFPIKDTSIPQALDNHVHVYCPMIYPLQAALKLLDPYVRIIIPYAMQHPDLFASCLMNQHMFWAQVTAPRGCKPDLKDTFRYRGLAIHELRQKLIRATNGSDDADVADDAAILTTLFLLGTDNLLGATGAFQAHRNALAKMIESRGGLDNLGLEGVLKNQLIRFNYFFQQEHGQPSFLPPNSVPRPQRLHYPPRHQLLLPPLASVVDNLPPALRDLALNGHLSLEVMTTLSQLTSWLGSLNRTFHRQATPQDLHMLSNHDTNNGSQLLMYLDLLESNQGGAGGDSSTRAASTTISSTSTLPRVSTGHQFHPELLLCAAGTVFLLTLHTGPRMRMLKIFQRPFQTLQCIFAHLSQQEEGGIQNLPASHRDLLLWSSLVLGTNLSTVLPRPQYRAASPEGDGSVDGNTLLDVMRRYCFDHDEREEMSWPNVEKRLRRNMFWVEMKARLWRSWWEKEVVVPWLWYSGKK